MNAIEALDRFAAASLVEEGVSPEETVKLTQDIIVPAWQRGKDLMGEKEGDIRIFLSDIMYRLHTNKEELEILNDADEMTMHEYLIHVVADLYEDAFKFGIAYALERMKEGA